MVVRPLCVLGHVLADLGLLFREIGFDLGRFLAALSIPFELVRLEFR